MVAARNKKSYLISKPRRWYVPFLHDQERLARDKERIDQVFINQTSILLQEWEYRPVEYTNSDSSRPLPSELLVSAERQARERVQRLDVELQRFRTYYEASASTKWKVLTAYLLLAITLSLFMAYGQKLMENYPI